MLDIKAIRQEFHAYGTPRSQWRVGGEFERLLLGSDGEQAGYFSPGGIAELLAYLVSEYGWQPIREGGNIIALSREDSSTTLEPGGQVELSGRPHFSLVELAEEAQQSMDELQSFVRKTGGIWVALGLTPYSKIQHIEWVPKGRYEVMKAYLPAQGEMAPVMMKATASFQANFDYEDEEDCGRKFNVLQQLAPLHTAMFANSPLIEGQATGWLSNRGRAWRRTDPQRTGFPAALKGGYSHEAWLQYLLDVPMMFVKQGDKWCASGETTFREFMEKGFQGRFPTLDDFRLHQTAVFPEVRVKSTIEVRGADACPLPLAIAGIALWTGFLYDPMALSQAEALGKEFADLAPVEDLFDGACRQGLEADFGRPFAAFGSELLSIAAAGLSRVQPEATDLLAPLRGVLNSGRSPGASVLSAWTANSSPEAFLKKVAYDTPS